MPSTMTTSTPAASAIGCEPMRAMPPVFASCAVTSIMGLQNPPECEGSRAYHRGGRRAQTKQRLRQCKKGCGQPLGEGWPRAIRSGTGRGGDVTGSRVSVFLMFAGAGGGDRRAAVAKRDPHVRIALRLTLDEAVSGLGPGHDVFVLVVEDELALIGLYRQHRVAF